MMERVGDRQEKMEGYCSTGQSPQRAVVPMEREIYIYITYIGCVDMNSNDLSQNGVQ
jgi:hypothetical protein